MKKFIKKTLIVATAAFIVFISLNNASSAQYLQNRYYNGADEEENYQDKYETIKFPKGTMIKGVLQHKISSAINNINDTVELMVMLGMQINGLSCVPKGTKILGNISKIGKPEIGKNASIQIIFNTIRISGKKDIKILGYIYTPEGYSTLGGELTDRVKTKTIVHKIQGIGGVLELIPDGPRKMGKDVEYYPGTEFLIVLEKDLTLKILKE